MRIFITMLLILKALSGFAQTIKFNVAGSIKDTTNARYAYLTTLSQQIPISSDKIFMRVPIKNGKFIFKGTYNLEGKDYQYACIIIDKRSNITKEEAKSKFKELIWVTSREENFRVIILEDINLNIKSVDLVRTATISNGGFLTKQRDELNTAIVARNRKVLEFIKRYPDSPLSFNDVEETANAMTSYNKEKIESRTGTMKELYNALSKRLKNSKRGLALKKLIFEKLTLL